MKLLAVGIVLALACSAPVNDLEIGKEVADIAFKPLEGKEIKLADFKKTDKSEGKVVVIYFWSCDCPSGKPLLPKAKEIAEKYAGDKSKVQFIAISSFGEKSDKVAKFCKDNEIKYLLCYDEGKKIAKHFGAKKVNTTFVIDQTGKLVYRGGLVTGKSDTSVDAVNAALEGKEAPKSDQDFAG